MDRTLIQHYMLETTVDCVTRFLRYEFVLRHFGGGSVLIGRVLKLKRTLLYFGPF